jgi:hypothetical protein
MTRASLSQDCRVTPAAATDIRPNVEGALTLIDNYLSSYRCTMRLAADGRQGFEVPAFLSLIGSTTAIALGAGTDVAILGGAGNSVFTAGNKYSAPQDQTEILSGAVDALACIQTEAVGISAFDLKTTAAAERTHLASEGGGAVEVSVERQYYNLVAAALIGVERAAAQRLARRGSFDAAGVAAEIETLVQKIEDAKKAREEAPVAPSTESVGFLGANKAAALHGSKLVQLKLDELQPKLQKCVVRAKA